LVLDNSGSMGAGARDEQGRSIPPNDPERAAVLGTLIVEGLARGTADRFSVLAFGENADAPPREARTADEIRGLPYASGTFFRRPLAEAGRRLRGSALPRKLFFFFTDGVPNDMRDPSEGPQALGLSATEDFERLIIGLYGSSESRQTGEAFLQPLARSPRDLIFVSTPQEVINAFTRGYARVLGSRPETGRLAPGESKTFEVGKYVVEVLVATASASPGPAYNARLEGPQGAIPSQASGDNGCGPGMPRLANAPRLCAPPYRHYQVFRAPNSPEAPSRWTLSLPAGQGPIDYGLILRYDLTASLAMPPAVRVGEPVQIDARLLFRGKTFDDASFFQERGFSAVATVEGKELPLRHAGEGRFVADWTPMAPSLEGAPTPVQVTFRNEWMEQSASRPVQVEGFLDLALVPNPARLDFGQWRGERKETERCLTVDLSGSTNADRIPINCTAQGSVQGGALRCTPVAGSEAILPGDRKGQPLRYEVCFTAESCCGELAPSGLGVVFAGTHPHYASGAVMVPAEARVSATGLLRCYWPWLVGLAGALFTLWVILGFVRPHDFDPA
ncbi:MAG TPA: vWA domain-containing protein, partial [Longimicrobium sp.]|nr:vWA domain-containing protein [Longimicrobium sp.]